MMGYATYDTLQCHRLSWVTSQGNDGRSRKECDTSMKRQWYNEHIGGCNVTICAHAWSSFHRRFAIYNSRGVESNHSESHRPVLGWRMKREWYYIVDADWDDYHQSCAKEKQLQWEKTNVWYDGTVVLSTASDKIEAATPCTQIWKEMGQTITQKQWFIVHSQ